MTPLTWVVGAGGLLGSALVRALAGDAWLPGFGVAWSDAERARNDLARALQAFALRVTEAPERPWAIAWCAGAGVVGTSQRTLDGETATFRHFLELLAQNQALSRMRGHFLLASSAGGVYGGALSSPITESTLPEPISAYGRTKLEQEEILLAWAKIQPSSISTLIARISNLYGPAQRLDKPQGLISQMSRCLIHNAPLHIYVSLDTIRDYLFSEDAGRDLAVGLERLAAESEREVQHVVKLYCSEREVSIAGLLGALRQITRRRLRIVSGVSAVGALQPRRLQFRSRVWPETRTRQVELGEGMSRVYRHQLASFAAGRLPSPLNAKR